MDLIKIETLSSEINGFEYDGSLDAVFYQWSRRQLSEYVPCILGRMGKHGLHANSKHEGQKKTRGAQTAFVAVSLSAVC